MYVEVKIGKRGRKYFAATKLGKREYACKVVINDVTKDFTEGQVVKLDAKDLSTISRYGTTLIYDASAVVTPEYLALVKWLREVEKWIRYAKDDVRQGWDDTNAIRTALSFNLSKFPDLAETVSELKKSVEANRVANEEREKTRELERERERTARAEESAKKRAELDARRVLINANYPPPLGKPWRYKNMSDGKIVVIVNFGKRFFVESSDACCYGLMPDDQWVRYAYFRDATAEECDTLIAEEQAAKKEQEELNACRKRFHEIITKIRDEGERPDNAKDLIPSDLASYEILFDTSNAYGGGDQICITKTHIWYLRGNGADGDNWSLNNYYGSIAWCLPRDESLVEELRKICPPILQKEKERAALLSI